MNIFPNLKSGKWIQINLNEESKKYNLDLSDPKVCTNFFNDFHKSNNCQYSYGGFLEDRTYLWRNHPNESDTSLIHLGIDYTVPAGTEISLPLDGEVIHIMKDPTNKIGWGGRIIWKLENGNYLLYGHLKQNINLKIGQLCKKGEIVCVLGDTNENGNWWPHLHVQLMKKEFIQGYAKNLDEINGYLPKNDPKLKNIINPEDLIFL